MAAVDDKKIIFSMVGVSKTIQQNQKQVLKNIYLSFFYGAKIGIIGLNGAGKSTLMKIIAGIDEQYQGEVVWSPGYSVGYLPQDPQLNEAKTENVRCASQFSFGKHIAFAKLFLGNIDLSLLVTSPNYFAPMHTTAVDSAAVIKYDTFNISHPQSLL